MSSSNSLLSAATMPPPTVATVSIEPKMDKFIDQLKQNNPVNAAKFPPRFNIDTLPLSNLKMICCNSCSNIPFQPYCVCISGHVQHAIYCLECIQATSKCHQCDAKIDHQPADEAFASLSRLIIETQIITTCGYCKKRSLLGKGGQNLFDHYSNQCTKVYTCECANQMSFAESDAHQAQCNAITTPCPLTVALKQHKFAMRNPCSWVGKRSEVEAHLAQSECLVMLKFFNDIQPQYKKQLEDELAKLRSELTQPLVPRQQLQYSAPIITAASVIPATVVASIQKKSNDSTISSSGGSSIGVPATTTPIVIKDSPVRTKIIPSKLQVAIDIEEENDDVEIDKDGDDDDGGDYGGGDDDDGDGDGDILATRSNINTDDDESDKKAVKNGPGTLWQPEADIALHKAVTKYGITAAAVREILKDPEFKPFFLGRSSGGIIRHYRKLLICTTPQKKRQRAADDDGKDEYSVTTGSAIKSTIVIPLQNHLSYVFLGVTYPMPLVKYHNRPYLLFSRFLKPVTPQHSDAISKFKNEFNGLEWRECKQFGPHELMISPAIIKYCIRTWGRSYPNNINLDHYMNYLNSTLLPTMESVWKELEASKKSKSK